jgi:hypothetical protein
LDYDVQRELTGGTTAKEAIFLLRSFGPML